MYEAFYGVNALIWRLVKKMAPPKAAPAGERQQYGMQILTTPTADTPGTTIALSFDSKRYLFGHLGEGTQRSFIQRGFGMRKLRNMFLTGSTNWKSNGGLLGFILTLADVQAGERSADDPEKRLPLHIHGSPMLLHTLATARRFIFRTGMPLTIQESTAQPFKWPSDPTYTDENIRVWSIPVRDADAAPEHNVDAETSETVRQEQTTRAKVVNDMFDSEWRRDRLIESPFKDVKLPAMVFVRDPDTKDLKGYHCPNHESAPHIQPSQTVLVRNPWPASLVTSLPPTTNLPCNVSMSYIVRGHQQRGQLDPKKAIALGVKPGPLFSELTAGRAVQAADGSTVTSEQVLGPPRASKGMAVFDLPSPGHLRHLHEILTTSPSDVLQDVSVAVWILGSGVASEEQFHQLLKTFDKLQHLVSDVDSAPNKLAFESTALSTARLAKINPTNFRIPLYNDEPYGEQGLSGTSLYAATGAIPVEAGMKIGLEPKYVMTRDDIPDANLSNLETSITSISSEQSQTTLQRSPLPSGTALTEPEITTLGTGSSQPSKYRNVSATLVRLPHNQGNFLLDCGENTLGQLRRAFPAEELQEVLRNLQGIWISHLHADHHLGTVSVLQERAKAFDALGPDAQTADRTIYLMSEKGMIDWIHEYSSVEPSLLSSTGLVLLVCNPTVGPMLGSQPFDVAASSSALQRVQTVRVSHCAGAQAVSITFKSGFKISYSGDCRPSSEFCRIGLHSDVLVHEATFDDEMQGDALAKKHSTTAEALGVALKMKAKNVLLTHFSQRYSKLPNLSSVKAPEEIRYEEGTAGQEAEPIEADGPPPTTDNSTHNQEQKTGASTPDRPSSVTPRPGTPLRSAFSNLPIAIAFDFMRIKVSEIAGAKQYYPAIQAMFDQQEAISDERREAARKAGEANLKNKNNKKMGWQQEKGTGKKSQNNNKGSGKRAQQIEEWKRKSSSNGELVSSSSADKLAEPQQGRMKMSSSEEKPTAMSPPRRTSADNNCDGMAPPISKRAQKRAAKRAATEQMVADGEDGGGGGKRVRND